MNQNLIAQLRLQNQQISYKQFETPKELVHYMVAIQAQDYLAALWAIGLRVSDSSIIESSVEQAIADREIVRTWPMRGTLHILASEDAKWMLQLLTPRVIKSSAGRHHQLELDENDFKKSRKLIEKALQDGQQLTRAELYCTLEDKGISTEGQRGYHILCYLAQNAVICFGPRRGKQHTFVLFDNWVPESRLLSGDEALAELGARYIKSRGPVTAYDFAYWSGLKITTSKKAFQLVEERFEKEEINDQTYWFSDFPKPPANKSSGIHLLPSFDEMICGYKNRSAILRSHQKSIILRNGIIKPLILKEGEVIGTWKRILKKGKVRIETHWFHKLPADQDHTSTKKAAEIYSAFIGLSADIDFQQNTL